MLCCLLALPELPGIIFSPYLCPLLSISTVNSRVCSLVPLNHLNRLDVVNFVHFATCFQNFMPEGQGCWQLTLVWVNVGSFMGRRGGGTWGV